MLPNPPPYGGVGGGSINNYLSFGNVRGEAFYIAPSISVIKNVYNEGLMQTWSTGIGTGAGPGQGAKPSGDWAGDTWVDVWAEPDTNGDDW